MDQNERERERPWWLLLSYADKSRGLWGGVGEGGGGRDFLATVQFS